MAATTGDAGGVGAELSRVQGNLVTVAPTASDEIRETRLSNGIRVVTELMPEARSVALGAWVGVGGRDEPDELAGASHFLEHLLFKGTPRRSARAIAEAVDAVGGDMNAFTTSEHTAYYARLPAARVDVGLDILGDVLTEPAFRPHEVDAERQVILEEILMNLDVPEDHVHTLLAEAVFPRHPLGREVLGSRATVEVVDRDQIEAFFHHWYQPRNLSIVAAGRLEHDQLVDALEATVGRLSGGERPERRPPGADPTPLVVHKDDTEQVHLTLGWRAVDCRDDDRFALSVVEQILGGGMASRLFQEVREQRGYCYSIYSWANAYADSGLAGIYAGTNPARLPELLAVLDDEVAKLVAEGVTEHELNLAKGYIEGSLVLGLESSNARMGRLGSGLVSRDEIMTIDEQIERLRAVTLDDAARVAARVFGGPRSVAVIGPVDESALG